MIFIRADANEHIGTGHIMRCISLACAFVDRGEEVLFVTADHNADSLIRQYNFECICLDSDWSDLESEGLCDLVVQYKPKLLVIDSYYVTNQYFDELKDITKTVYFDDLNLQCWNVDYLINYNIYANVFDYAGYSDTKTKLLLNPKYAPLRAEFLNCPNHEIKTVTGILVSAGGSDPENITEKIISNICNGKDSIVFHFVIGALNPRLERIKTLAKGKDNIVLHINEKRMSDLMKNCDMAISAAGSTLYELCVTGVPTIMYTLADNQLAAAEQFYKQGIMCSAGDCRGDSEFLNRLQIIIEDLINDYELRRKLSENMQHLVDGNGAARIVKELL